MKCPECGAWSLVLNTRNSPTYGHTRRRECGNKHRFTTAEQVIADEKIAEDKRERIKGNRDKGNEKKKRNTASRREQISRLRSEGWTVDQLARKFGVEIRTIYRALRLKKESQ